MKIMGIDKGRTVDESEIAFKLDVAPTDGLLEQVSYGALQLTVDGDLLIVKMPKGLAEPFGAASVATLNRKLAEVDRAIESRAVARDTLLQRIASDAGLPLV